MSSTLIMAMRVDDLSARPRRRKSPRRADAYPVNEERSESPKVASKPPPKTQLLVAPSRDSVFPLATLSEVPPWVVYNTSVLTGYRRWDVSFGACLRSLFQLHNETGNIWTHLLGFLYFGSLLHSTLSELPEASDAERLAIGSFLVGCMVCMGLSVAYHTFGSLSRRAHDVLLRLDYTGITVQILCSFVPCVYYWSPPALQAAYLAGLTLVCAGALVLIQCYLFGHASRRPQRTLVYTLLGGCVAMPLLHGLAHDWGTPRFGAAARNFALSCVMGALFAFGGLLYVVRLPERRAPGKYDYVLNSHQLFHTLTVVAALLQHRLVMQAYAMAHAEASVLDESFSVFDA